MLKGLIFLALVFSGGLTARADVPLKIINFTADWCPNCQVLNPRMARAMRQFDPNDMAMVNLDMTNAGRNASMAASARAIDIAQERAEAHKAGPLWRQYGGTTGLGVMIASDDGTVLGCLMRPMSEQDIADALRLALIFAEAPAETRQPPTHINCPA